MDSTWVQVVWTDSSNDTYMDIIRREDVTEFCNDVEKVHGQVKDVSER